MLYCVLCAVMHMEMYSFLATKRLIYAYTWNLLMQSMVLQIMDSNYHVHLKYFGITNGVVFGIKKKCARF